MAEYVERKLRELGAAIAERDKYTERQDVRIETLERIAQERNIMIDALAARVESLARVHQALADKVAARDYPHAVPAAELHERIAKLEAENGRLRRIPTHQCRACGALWTLWPEGGEYPGSWCLWSGHAGPCCDNEVMAEQIGPLTASEAFTAMQKREAANG